MPRFNSREEYEAWKAQQQTRESSTPAPRVAPRSTRTPPPQTAQGGASDWEWLWVVRTDSEHRVRLRLSPLGRETVLVDDVVVASGRSFRLKSEREFDVGPGSQGLITVRMGLSGAIKAQLKVDGELVPTYGTPSNTFGAASFFPRTDTIAGARMAAGQGVVAAAFMGVVTGVLGMLSGAGMDLGPLEINPWLALLEAFVFAAFAIGIHRMLRSVAVVALLFFLYDRVMLVRFAIEDPEVTLGVGAFLVSIWLFVAYVNAVRGTFAYRGFVEGAAGRVAWTLPGARETAAVVGVLVLLGIAASFFWGRVQRRARLEGECAAGKSQACLDAAAGTDDTAAARELYGKACGAGALAGCLELVSDVETQCAEGDGKHCQNLLRIYERDHRVPEARQVRAALCRGGDTAACASLFNSLASGCLRAEEADCARLLELCRDGDTNACRAAESAFGGSCASSRQNCQERAEVVQLGCELGDEFLCNHLATSHQMGCQRGSPQDCLAYRAVLERQCRESVAYCSRLYDLEARLCDMGYDEPCAEVERQCSLGQQHACGAIERSLGRPCARGLGAACDVLRRHCMRRARETSGPMLPGVCTRSLHDLRNGCKLQVGPACDVLRALCSAGVRSACENGRSEGVQSFTPGR